MRPGIGGGFDSSHRPVVGTFDRFNGFSSNILLTFSCSFGNPQMPWGVAFEQKLSAQFKCPTYAQPPSSSLTLIGALNVDIRRICGGRERDSEKKSHGGWITNIVDCIRIVFGLPFNHKPNVSLRMI